MTERDIFIAALQQPSPAKRAAYLDGACGGDGALRGRVDELLREQAQLGSFLERPAGGLGGTGPFTPAPGEEIPTAPAEGPGAVIGPYKLLQQIGEGGMGAVFMAEQMRPVRRKVALKLIRPGMDSRQVVARFEAERQALALMDHPNIAKVFDGGATDSGRPFFVMELVKGVPITKFCDEHKLTPRQRLELFGPVCQAVQHAHQKGVIHRDLKPSNVLMALYDGKPVPKVIDFGIAKAAGQSLTDKTLFTAFGSVVGTLEYMSPEQAQLNQLDIDTRSDVYSLGVLLYELLTGSTPFSRKELGAAGLLDTLRVIREREPTKPSKKLSTAEGLPTLAANRGTEPAKLMKLVRGELDWIVMKALEKDRGRRYETANGFAMDLRRYLADEPVLACPPSAGYRLRKFIRRNKGGLAVAALVLFFLVLLGAGIGWVVRERAAREADATRQQAERYAKVAGQVELSLSEVDRLEREQNWPEALAAARRAEAAVAGGEADAETTQRVRERLTDLEFIDRLEQIRTERPTNGDREYARAFRDQGVDIDALAVEASVERLKARPGLAIPLAAALDDWVFLRRSVPGGDAAGWKRLAAVARGIDPEPLRDRLRSTWGRPVSETQDELRRLAESMDIRAQHPATLVCLAHTLWQVELPDSAIRILRDGQSAHAGDFWLNLQLGYALYTHQRDLEGAIRFYTAAVSIRPHSAAALNDLGRALRSQGKLGRSQDKLDEAVACLNKAIELDPKNSAYRIDLGYALGLRGKVDEAIDAYREALRLQPGNAYARLAFGCFLRDIRHDYEGAIACFKQAIELDQNDAPGYEHLAWLLATCSDARFRDPGQAVALAKRAVELAPKSGIYATALGVAQYRAGDWKAAIAALETSMELRNGDTSNWFFLAMAHWQLGEKDKARDWYDRAVQWMDKNQPTDEELSRFREEAAELLRLNEKK